MFGPKDKKTKKPSIEEIRAQAMANARAARANIGEETLQRIASAIQTKQQQSAAMEKARDQIMTHDVQRLTQELRNLIEEHS